MQARRARVGAACQRVERGLVACERQSLQRNAKQSGCGDERLGCGDKRVSDDRLRAFGRWRLVVSALVVPTPAG